MSKKKKSNIIQYEEMVVNSNQISIPHSAGQGSQFVTEDEINFIPPISEKSIMEK